MKFLLVHSSKLKVTLESTDLKSLDISYEAMDYSHPGTRQMLVGLLERGRDQTGFNPRRAKLYIEVYPAEDGGMVIYFTALSAGQASRPGGGRGPVPVVFAFADANNLTAACCKTYACYGHRIYRSALYRLSGEWRLIVYPLDYVDRLSVYFLGEFASPVGEGEVLAAFVREHGDEVIAEGALDTLAKYFG